MYPVSAINDPSLSLTSSSCQSLGVELSDTSQDRRDLPGPLRAPAASPRPSRRERCVSAPSPLETPRSLPTTSWSRQLGRGADPTIAGSTPFRVQTAASLLPPLDRDVVLPSSRIAPKPHECERYRRRRGSW
nr:uncharacterized protein LOC127319544 isoform X2 [Lolium perenne]